MDREQLQELYRIYRGGLLNDVLPFWIPRAIDRQRGGYWTCFDRDGTLVNPDKPVWFQGRFAWLLATLYNTVEPRSEWLELSRHGIDFINRHCFDRDGRMYFLVTQDGQPLRKRRYLFSECFAIVALAAYGQAAKERKYVEQAGELLQLVLKYSSTPGLCQPKVDQVVRPQKGLAMPMIMIVTAQELRKAGGDAAFCTALIDRQIAEIERDFLKPEFKCLLETVGPQGEFIDTFDGRQINPGHSLEAGWFILEEARQRGGSARLEKLGLQIIDWSFALGWDSQCGGILYYRDAKGLPGSEYWHDMKFWWPHNEAIIATLLAYRLTGDAKYAGWHRQVHDWSYQHFPDPEYGEWYGYLHRDGSLSTTLKGSLYKGPFHLPRMQWYCSRLLAEMLGE